MNRNKIIITILLALIFGLVPVMLERIGSSYYYSVAITAMIWVILAVSMNFITGTAGLLTLGHGAFYGIGAYTAALLSTRLELSFMLTLPLSGLMAAAVGVAVALPTMRLVFIYFAVATLAIGEIIYVTLLNWVSFTRGPMGIDGVLPMDIFGMELESNLSIYMMTAFITAVSVYVFYRLTHSYYGNALRSCREDDQCAEAMGIHVIMLKIQVFGVSTFFAGVAGAIWAHTSGYISPDNFRFSESILVLAMVVVGGLGSVPGAVIGSLLLILLPEVARDIGDWRQMAVGLVMFCSILFLPKGIFGEVRAVDFVRRQLGAAWPGTDKKVGWR
ncbi:MAG: branched-chain amino acid ABC transporter permease [Desulforhopalus sp.]